MSKDRKVKIMTVTPEIAERWLAKNTHNRPMRNHLVTTYTIAMKRGEWKLTPEPIIFSKPFRDPATMKDFPETLMEGQHRLWAVVESKATVQFTVWWNCEPDEFEVIGQGSERTQGDILSYTRSDLKNPTLLASVVASFARHGLGYGNSVESWVVRIILGDCEPEAVEIAAAKQRLSKMAPRPLTAALLLGAIVNPSQTGVLIKQLKDAIGFTERDPARALHLYITNQLVATNRDTPDVMFYKCANAVAAKLKGHPLQVLRVNAEGIAWLRDAGRAKLEPMVRAINGRMPAEFYTPRLQHLTADTTQEQAESVAAS